MFLTDGDFRQALADTLKVDVAQLSAYWDRQCQQAHQSAYLDVRGALLSRGFTASQIDSWERGAEFERDIGLYWALVRGATIHNLGAESINLLDRRQELLSVMVELDTGVPQEPAGSPPRIGSGNLDTTNDTWTRDTPL